MTQGNNPTDDGNFIFSEDEATAFIKKYPAQASKPAATLTITFAAAYGFAEMLNDEPALVAELIKLYERLARK